MSGLHSSLSLLPVISAIHLPDSSNLEYLYSGSPSELSVSSSLSRALCLAVSHSSRWPPRLFSSEPSSPGFLLSRRPSTTRASPGSPLLLPWFFFRCLAALAAPTSHSLSPWPGRFCAVVLFLGLAHEQADEVLVFFLVLFLRYWPLGLWGPPPVLLGPLYLWRGCDIMKVFQLLF